MTVPAHLKKKLDDCVSELARELPKATLIGGLIAHAVRLTKEQNEPVSSLITVIQLVSGDDAPKVGVN